MKLFFELLQIALGHRTSLSTTPSTNEWEVIYEESERHTITGFLLHAIDNLPKEQRPPQSLLLQWIGVGLKEYEYRYELYREAIAEMASWYNSHGYKMMVLKGYACSLDWPNPEYRPCGDIDIWLFGKQKEADALMSRELGLKIDASHHHHTVFSWRVFVVENHYDFINVYAHKSNAELEKIFKELGKDDSHFVEVMITSTGSATKIYLPSPNLHALFLVKHMASHFASSEISLRQVLDWAFFVEGHTKEIDWEWLLDVLNKYHMKVFFNLINAICVEDLGFAAGIFPEVQFLPDLKERVLADILDPAYSTAEPASLFPRMAYKYRRWQGNAWKQRLCYSESRWENFWTGLWAHILKPSSI